MSKLSEILRQLTQMGQKCVYCDKEISSDKIICEACEVCEKKLLNKDGFCNGILYTYQYDGVARDLIRRFKYGDSPRYSMFLAQKMADFLQDYELAVDLITFVPIHKNRLRQRGFDQSELIATHLALLLNIECKSLLIRKRDTKPQYQLNAQQRIQNIKGAFALSKDYSIHLKDQNILLIDDIYTTGITVSECMNELKKAGTNVMVYTFAKEMISEDKCL
ncbi:MAG: ComF family protein [Christensenellaceae bacterium]